MPATDLAITDCPGKYSQTGTALTVAAADTVNSNRFVVPRDCLVIAHNAGASSRTITITSQPDKTTGRTGHVSAQAIAAGEIRIFRLTPEGWANPADSKAVTLSANHADVKFGVVDLTKNLSGTT